MLSGKVTNSELLCEYYLCQDNIHGYLYSSVDFGGTLVECNTNCKNTNRNKEGCDREVALPSGKLVKPSHICNDVRDLWTGEDEANCNGYTYGMYCKRRNKLSYRYLAAICDGYKDCDDGKDEADCRVINTTEISCRRPRLWGGHLVPVHNFTRCTPMRVEYTQYCKSKDIVKQHTNCTDPSRVGVKCEINGYPSTISKYIICYKDKITACDDGIESKCLNTRSCRVHKHAMCDNKEDCVDLADENHPYCRSMTKATCKRRGGTMGELPIPISWLRDGIWDCQNGADETADWPTCG